MAHLKYLGPSSILYTHGRTYPVRSESPVGWIIQDDMGIITNVAKRGNVLWKVGEDK